MSSISSGSVAFIFDHCWQSCRSKKVYKTKQNLKLSCNTTFTHAENACVVRASWAKPRLVTKVKTQRIAFWIEIFLFKNWKCMHQKVETACVNAPLLMRYFCRHFLEVCFSKMAFLWKLQFKFQSLQCLSWEILGRIIKYG